MIFIEDDLFEPEYFGDGTLKMLFMNDYSFFEDDVTTLTWNFDNIGEYATLMTLVSYIKDVRRSKVELYLPYVPNARMDRVKDPNKECHTLKYFCNFINSLGFEKVTVLDPHSPVTMTLLDRCVEETIGSFLRDIVSMYKIDLFLFPDKGAKERYSYLNIRPAEYGEKTRNWETGRIDGFKLMLDNPRPAPFYGKSILLIDDIIAYGSTMNHAVNAAYKAGANHIYIWATHCENDILKGDLINNPLLDKIFTTGSIYRSDHKKISVLD